MTTPLVAPAAASFEATTPDADALPAPPTSGLLSLQQLLIGASVGFLALQLLSRLLCRYRPAFTNREVYNLRETQK